MRDIGTIDYSGDIGDVLLLDFAGQKWTNADHNIGAYLADGSFLGYRAPVERADGKTQQSSLYLAPTPAVMAVVHDIRFKVAVLYQAAVDANHALIDQYEVGTFFMSHPVITGEKKGLAIEAICYSENMGFRRRNGVISSGDDQNARYTGDTFFDYTAKAPLAEINWGGLRQGGGGDGPAVRPGYWDQER